MDNELLNMIIEIVITVAAFFVGRYVLPKVKTDLQTAVNEFTVILNYAESYVTYARQFLSEMTGSEKMDAVIDKLKIICDQKGITVDDETLRAIAQKAYDAMKAGEISSNIILETAVNDLVSGIGDAVDGTIDKMAESETVDDAMVDDGK